MSGTMTHHGARDRRARCRWEDQVSIPDTSSQYSWKNNKVGTEPELLTNVGQRLQSLYKKQLYTDVKFFFNCGAKSKSHLSAHKAILAIGSPKFAEMLYSGAAARSKNESQLEIKIDNVPFQAFSHLVEYLYTDEVYFENHHNVMEILTVAKQFQVQPLVSRCESYFESLEITADTACINLQLAITHNFLSLKSRCSQFIQDNTAVVLRSSNFKDCNRYTVLAICKMQKLNLHSEGKLLEGIIAWLEAANDRPLIKRSLVEPFLEHIRFLTMGCNEFSQMMKKFPDLLTTEEVLNIVIYLSNTESNRSTKNLPSWCNKLTLKRCFYKTGTEQRHRDPSIAHGEQKISLCLKPTQRRNVPSLVCVLKLKCFLGKYRVKALKLSFGAPVTPASFINKLVITVAVEPSKYTFKEHIRICNSQKIVVSFTKLILVQNGDTVYFRAAAKQVKNYNFLQFEEEHSFLEDGPFECSVGSIPEVDRLFFISDVIYESQNRLNKF